MNAPDLAALVSKKMKLSDHGVSIVVQIHQGAKYFVILRTYEGRMEQFRLLTSITDESRLMACATSFVANL